jgi:D-aspartate ligase
MTTDRPMACVLGDMDLLRPLGIAGIPCAVVAQRGDAVRFSRFARAAVEWSDAWDRPAELVEALVAFAAAQPERPVLFYEQDRELLMISRERERLARHFRFVVAERELVEDLVDKGRFQALARRLALPVPPAVSLAPAEHASPPALDLRFPLVVKPLTRRTDHWAPVAGSGKALSVDTPDALRALWPRLAASHGTVLLQELIPGDERCIESYHVYVDERDAVVGEFTGKKIRTRPARFGHTTALEITDTADVAALGRDVCARLGLRGVAKLDFKRGPDGRLHLLEINPRFTLWNHAGAVAGVNIPALVYADLAGLPRPAAQRARSGVRWSKPWQDALAARAEGTSTGEWLRWARDCEAKKLVAWDDPLPLLLGGVARGLAASRALGAGMVTRLTRRARAAGGAPPASTHR